jgi:hypothetical protein
MSAHEPRPAPRRRKLVLRKIADGEARGSTPEFSNSYTGPLPSVRPPGTTPMPFVYEAVDSVPSLPSVPSLSGTLSGTTSSRARLSAEMRAAEEARALEDALIPDDESLEDALVPDEDPSLAETPFLATSSQDWGLSPAADASLRGARAWGNSSMTPSAPRIVPIPIHSVGTPEPPSPEPSFPEPAPFRAAAYGSTAHASSIESQFASDGAESVNAVAPRSTMAPVAHSLAPAPMFAAFAGSFRPTTRRRLSADSKLLAAGGALAAAMLLVAMGVLLGQHTARPDAFPAVATRPVVIEMKAPSAAPLPPAAAASPVAFQGKSGESQPASGFAPTAAAETLGGPATIDVQQLPAAPLPRVQPWAAVAPKSALSGWTVAPQPHPKAPAIVAAPVATDIAADPPEAVAAVPDPSAIAAAAGPVASAAATPPVDPFVQAVRDDIREDEARTK